MASTGGTDGGHRHRRFANGRDDDDDNGSNKTCSDAVDDSGNQSPIGKAKDTANDTVTHLVDGIDNVTLEGTPNGPPLAHHVFNGTINGTVKDTRRVQIKQNAQRQINGIVVPRTAKPSRNTEDLWERPCQNLRWHESGQVAGRPRPTGERPQDDFVMICDECLCRRGSDRPAMGALTWSKCQCENGSLHRGMAHDIAGIVRTEANGGQWYVCDSCWDEGSEWREVGFAFRSGP